MEYIFSKIRQIKRVDFSILISVIVLGMYGTISIFNVSGSNLASKQLLFIIVSLILLCVILLIDYVKFKPFIPLIYYSNIALLLFTKIFTEKVNGANGWISVGSFTIQPSEFMKISIILMLAKVMEENQERINENKFLLKLIAYILVPLLVIVIQPDMGMTLVCFIMCVGMLFIGGLNIRFFLFSFLFSIFSILIVWDTGILPPYWKTRVISFLNPSSDVLGNGLQVVQSKIGVGSGGIFGKNIGFNSTGSSYVSEFVPEPQNDFIFSIIGEYWGFIGSVLLLILFSIIILRMLKIARYSRDVFGELFCIGMVFYMLYAVFQNIGMTIGLLPVTGINLPFVSYGGSSVLSNMIGIAIVLNINIRRHPIIFND